LHSPQTGCCPRMVRHDGFLLVLQRCA
jgi:hypothetical protein